MAAFVVCALCALVILKPQEFVKPLQALPVLYILFGAAVVAIVLAIVWRRIRPALAPQIPLVVAFFGWILVTTALKRPEALTNAATNLAIVLAVFLSVAFGLSSKFGARLFAITFLGCALVVTWVALSQARSQYGCMRGAPDDWEGKGELTYDGRPCETVLDCRVESDPDANYRCELVGPLGTSSVGGRVRYRGSLADPNELSLVVAIAIPFAIALWHDRRRRPEVTPGRAPLPLLVSDRLLDRLAGLVRAIPTTAVVVAIAATIVFAQSRGGLLVFLTVLGLYFVRKAGKWGVVAGCLVAPPMLLVGGRSGVEAEESAGERVQLLREAFDLVRQTKGVGVGYYGFPDNSSIGMTAHNAYVLALAEAGIVGALLFGLALYASIKVPVAIWLADDGRFDATLRRLAPAVAISLAGALVGILFLSWTYKDILYILLGASAALYGVARAQDPTFRVKLSAGEVGLVGLGTFGLLFAVWIGTRLHG